MWLDVDPTNHGDRPLSFSYAERSEIVQLFLAQSHGREQPLLGARPGVAWFTARPGAGPRTEVELAPGATHRLAIALARYFDVPLGGDVVVWLSCRLPGLHTAPARRRRRRHPSGRPLSLRRPPPADRPSAIG